MLGEWRLASRINRSALPRFAPTMGELLSYSVYLKRCYFVLCDQLAHYHRCRKEPLVTRVYCVCLWFSAHTLISPSCDKDSTLNAQPNKTKRLALENAYRRDCHFPLPVIPLLIFSQHSNKHLKLFLCAFRLFLSILAVLSSVPLRPYKYPAIN